MLATFTYLALEMLSQRDYPFFSVTAQGVRASRVLPERATHQVAKRQILNLFCNIHRYSYKHFFLLKMPASKVVRLKKNIVPEFWTRSVAPFIQNALILPSLPGILVRKRETVA